MLILFTPETKGIAEQLAFVYAGLSVPWQAGDPERRRQHVESQGVHTAVAREADA